MTNNTTQFPHNQVVVRLTLDSWGRYGTKSEREDQIIDVFAQQKTVIIHDNQEDVIRSLVNDVLPNFNTDEKHSIEITIDHLFPFEMWGKVLTAFADYHSPNADISLQLAEGDFLAQEEELRKKLVDSLEVNLITADEISINMLSEYLKIRARFMNTPFINEDDVIKELFQEGQRDFYGVVVDQNCTPIKDKWDKFSGFFDEAMRHLKEEETKQKAA